MNRLVALLTAGLCFICTRAFGSIVEYTDVSAWQAAAGPYTTIDFTGMPPGIITTQYQQFGILFTDGNDRIEPSSSFVQDGWGLNGWLDDTITLAFSQEMTSIALHYPGGVRLHLYRGDELIYTSGIFSAPPPQGINGFVGLMSTIPFDKAILEDLEGLVFADNLYFGRPIPAPGAIVALAMGALIQKRRR